VFLDKRGDTLFRFERRQIIHCQFVFVLNQNDVFRSLEIVAGILQTASQKAMVTKVLFEHKKLFE
jgi:hypothetical protein